uniref:Uncharacterized protein n=1 Tax=Arundo donax TaxID=35708 RepID=A0A0A8ZMI7_ARUDO
MKITIVAKWSLI